MSANDAAASLGSVGDIWVIIALIIPGFIMFRILSWLAAYEAKFDQFTTTIYSLICSLIVFLPVSAINGLTSLDQIRMHILSPQILAELIGFGALFGTIPGMVLKLTMRSKFAFGSAWDNFAQNYAGKAVVLYTTDGKKYVGWIKRMSVGKDEKREVTLGNPRLVKKGKDKDEYVDLGEELLFSESVIQRILRRAPKRDQVVKDNGTQKEQDKQNNSDDTSSHDTRLFDIHLTSIQLKFGLIMAIGASLIGVGIGFTITVLPALKAIIDEDGFNRELVRVLENHTGINMTYSGPTQAINVLNGTMQIAGLYALVGFIIVGLGIWYARQALRSQRPPHTSA